MPLRQYIESRLKQLLIHLFTMFRSPKQYRPEEVPLHSLKRILIIRQHDQLGDLLITTPALRALRKAVPNAHLTMVVREYTYPMMMNNPHVDDIIIFYEKFNRWNIAKIARFLKKLRGKESFDCAIVLNTISRSVSSDIIAILSRSKYIVGPDHIPLVTGRRELIYNVQTKRSKKYQTQIQHNLDIVNSIGVPSDGTEYDLVPTNEERISAETIYQGLDIPKQKSVIGIHFGTLDDTRRFPLEKLAEVIDWMIDTYSCNVILLVGPNEIEQRKYLLSMLTHSAISAPVMPLRVAAAFMKHLTLFLCNDTGTLHIASAMRIPTVSFHGPNDPEIWKPPHARHIPVRAADTKITSITVEQAQNAIKQQLSN